MLIRLDPRVPAKEGSTKLAEGWVDRRWLSNGRQKKRSTQSQKRETGHENESERRDMARDRANKQYCGHNLNTIQTIERPDISAMQTEAHWKVIHRAVGSGATDTVAYIESLQSVQTKKGLGSKNGTENEVANGERIPNLGEKHVLRVTTEGVSKQIVAQMCDVNKPLLSVKKIMSAGKKVAFDPNGSYIEDKTTQENMWTKEEGGCACCVWLSGRSS